MQFIISNALVIVASLCGLVSASFPLPGPVYTSGYVVQHSYRSSTCVTSSQDFLKYTRLGVCHATAYGEASSVKMSLQASSIEGSWNWITDTYSDNTCSNWTSTDTKIVSSVCTGSDDVYDDDVDDDFDDAQVSARSSYSYMEDFALPMGATGIFIADYATPSECLADDELNGDFFHALLRFSLPVTEICNSTTGEYADDFDTFGEKYVYAVESGSSSDSAAHLVGMGIFSSSSECPDFNPLWSVSITDCDPTSYSEWGGPARVTQVGTLVSDDDDVVSDIQESVGNLNTTFHEVTPTLQEGYLVQTFLTTSSDSETCEATSSNTAWQRSVQLGVCQRLFGNSFIVAGYDTETDSEDDLTYANISVIFYDGTNCESEYQMTGPSPFLASSAFTQLLGDAGTDVFCATNYCFSSFLVSDCNASTTLSLSTTQPSTYNVEYKVYATADDCEEGSDDTTVQVITYKKSQCIQPTYSLFAGSDGQEYGAKITGCSGLFVCLF